MEGRRKRGRKWRGHRERGKRRLNRTLSAYSGYLHILQQRTAVEIGRQFFPQSVELSLMSISN